MDNFAIFLATTQDVSLAVMRKGVSLAAVGKGFSLAVTIKSYERLYQDARFELPHFSGSLQA